MALLVSPGTTQLPRALEQWRNQDPRGSRVELEQYSKSDLAYVQWSNSKIRITVEVMVGITTSGVICCPSSPQMPFEVRKSELLEAWKDPGFDHSGHTAVVDNGLNPTGMDFLLMNVRTAGPPTLCTKEV